jgi:hypothetical protein
VKRALHTFAALALDALIGSISPRGARRQKKAGEGGKQIAIL